MRLPAGFLVFLVCLRLEPLTAWNQRGVTCAFAANDLYRETWGQFTRSLLRILLLGDVFLPKDHGSKSNKIVAWWSFDMVKWCWVWQEFGETREINVNHNVFLMFWGLRWWHRDFFEATPSKARNRNQTLFITFPDMQRATFVFDCFLNASSEAVDKRICCLSLSFWFLHAFGFHGLWSRNQKVKWLGFGLSSATHSCKNNHHLLHGH